MEQPLPQIKIYKRDYFDTFYDSLAKSSSTESAALVIEQIDELLRSFRENRLHPVEIGSLLKAIADHPQVDESLRKTLADRSWELSESDDWDIFATAIGKLEVLVRERRSRQSPA